MLTSDPPKGSNHETVTINFEKKIGSWKKSFADWGGEMGSTWRIYFHILEVHAADMYYQFGNLQPWAAEAREQVHYLDCMHFYQSSQQGFANLNTKVLTTRLRFQYSHSLTNQYQTSLNIPQEI